jgi:hypothetical protein
MEAIFSTLKKWGENDETCVSDTFPTSANPTKPLKGSA